MPGAVRDALRRGEPSPLAVAWRATCESYRRGGEEDGSTATAALIADDGRCQLLNCGDSRGLLAACEPASGDVVVDFATKDHSASDDTEQDRIRRGGGTVQCSRGVWRVKVESPQGTWRVAVPRALGGSQVHARRSPSYLPLSPSVLLSSSSDLPHRLPWSPSNFVWSAVGWQRHLRLGRCDDAPPERAP